MKTTVEVRSLFGDKRVVVKVDDKQIEVFNYISDAQVKEIARDFHADEVVFVDNSVAIKLSQAEAITIKASIKTVIKLHEDIKQSLLNFRRWCTWSDEQVQEYNYATDEIVKLNSILNKLG